MPSYTSSSNEERAFSPDSNRWILAAVLAITAFLAIALLAKIDPPRDKDNTAIRAAAALGPDTRLISMGTSHVLCGIDPSILWSNAVNIATPGVDYEMLLLILKHHISNLTGLEAVLLEADNICASNLGFSRTDFSELYDYGVTREELPLKGWAYARQVVMESSLLAPIFFSSRLTPWVHVRKPAMERIPRGLGFEVYTGVVSSANNGLVKIRSHENVLSPFSVERNLVALKDIIDILKSNEVPVIMVTMPHDRLYTAHAGPVWHATFDRVISTASSNLAPDFIWWNFDGHPDFTDEDFNDGHHVNERGAQKVSQLIHEKLKKVLRSQED